MRPSALRFRLATFVAAWVLCTLVGTSNAVLDYDHYNVEFEDVLRDAIQAANPQNSTEAALVYERTLITFGIRIATDARVDERQHFDQTIARARGRLEAVYTIDDLAVALPAIRVDFGENWNYVSDAVEGIKTVVTPLQLRGAQMVCEHRTTAADEAKLDRLLNYYQDALKKLAELKEQTAARLDDIMAQFEADVWQAQLEAGDDVTDVTDEVKERAQSLLGLAIREQAKVLEEFSNVTLGVHNNTDSEISAEL